MIKKNSLNKLLICFFIFLLLPLAFLSYAADTKGGSIVVNGDTVEYSTDTKEVIASDNVSVVYKGTKLICDKLTVNTDTKDGVAEGHVRIEDARGIIIGDKATYNFETKTGTIFTAEFRANPYFGKAEKIEKAGDKEFVALGGYVSTCNYDHPHYRIQSDKVDMFPGDKIQTKGNRFYINDLPVFYLPYYNHSLKPSENIMHVRVSPGSRKEWGGYVLSAWRYNLTDYVDGSLYLDYRQRLGFAEGFGANYNTRYFGKGDLKVYYTDEKPETRSISEPDSFQRYLVRLRHKWDIDKRTYLTAEYYKIYDEKRKFAPTTDGFLKEYFYREYEKDSQPLSYVLLQHYFDYSSLSLLFQERANHWYNYLEKKPEIKYSLPRYQIASTPFYFANYTTLADFNQNNPVLGNDTTVARFDTYNEFSWPVKLWFMKITPFAAERGTFYDKGSDGSTALMRAIFYTGAEASTKIYRVFDVKTKWLGMNIDGLRHIITPSISYNYNHRPTIDSSQLKQIDAVDSIRHSSAVNLELSNKLQTKRDGQGIDLLDFRVTTAYLFNGVDPITNIKTEDKISDIFLQLKFLPFNWLRIDTDATYKHTGRGLDPNYGHFSDINYNINFVLGQERSLGIGQRFQREGSNEITAGFNWRVNPKWKFSIYERYNASAGLNISQGLREQEYTVSRDFHCWIVDIGYNISQDDGHTVWFVFKLKAFPETEFGFDQSYAKPQSGSQSQ